MSFKPVSEMQGVEEFLKHFLPEGHNNQDIIYLTCRYKWEKSSLCRKVEGHQDRESIRLNLKEMWQKSDLAWDNMLIAYHGTTFEMKNFPHRYKIASEQDILTKNHVKNDRSREAQQPLF